MLCCQQVIVFVGLCLHAEAVRSQLVGHVHRWKRVQQENLESHGRWAVSGVVVVGNVQAVELQSLLKRFKPMDNLTPYHHIRTRYPTVIYPHNMDEYLGNYTFETKKGWWCSSNEGCCSTQRAVWSIYTEFGRDSEAAAFHRYLQEVLVSQLKQDEGLCITAAIGMNPVSLQTSPHMIETTIS